jgi:hypothetical protein
MDTVNRFHTRETWLWVRAEHLLLLAILIGLAVWHIAEIRWIWFIVSFVGLDLVGYLPGAIAFRRSPDGRIATIYHHFYNFTHSYVTAAVIIGLWAWTIDGWEWAMLGIPIHLSGDRGLFGNTYKPPSLPFEPVAAASPSPPAPLPPWGEGSEEAS